LRAPQQFRPLAIALLGIAVALGSTAAVEGQRAKRPAAPTSPTPSDGALNVPLDAVLGWTSSGATSYTFYFGTTNPPAYVATLSSSSYKPWTTSPQTKYYWHVVANNSRGSTAGPIWSFTTVASGTNPTSPVTSPTPTPTPEPTPEPTHDHTLTDSAAFGLWVPAAGDTCTKEQHDAYSVMGADGKRYPTWHPPTGPNGCTFGHEHGRDPSGSALLGDVTALYGGLLFGYGNEQLDVWNSVQGITNGMRHEDHVGHKVEWENGITIYESTTTGGASRRALDVTCDFLMKVHQGTHSKDAFTNNVHELLYAMQCHDGPGGSIGSKVIVTKMVAFGAPGGFSEGSVAGGFTPVNVGTATPLNSPTGGGLRSLPTINRVLESILVPSGQWSQFSLGLYEDWISSNYIRRAGQVGEILYFDPHFAVFSPSRFYWPGSDPNTYGITRTDADRAGNVGRSVDVCWMRQTINGSIEQARGGECDSMTNYGAIASPFRYDDPRSNFNGVHREFYFNNTVIVNTGSTTVWYTDPFGDSATAGTLPGTIPQFISAVDNRKRTESGLISSSGRAYPLESVAIGKERSYGGSGVHAPN
jgi:hypothetical protein